VEDEADSGEIAGVGPVEKVDAVVNFIAANHPSFTGILQVF